MTFRPEQVRAVVFDIGGVFLFPHYQPVLDMMQSHDLDTPSDLDAFRRAHHAGVYALATAGGETREHDASFWTTYDTAYATAVGVPEALTGEFEIAIRQTWDWRHDENIAAFHRLHDAGVPTAIVSNNNGTAPDQMRDHGVCQVLDGPLPRVAAIIDSALVGVAKPDPTIMNPALYALGLPPDEVLYVGDTVQADVAAATAAGMQVVQLDPFDHHRDFGHARLPDVASIADAIGH